MPITFENFLEKNFTDSDPIRPPDPVINKIDINLFKDINSIGITASASSPEIMVKSMLDKFKKIFKIKVIESIYEKEDIHFKIPAKLKEVN